MGTSSLLMSVASLPENSNFLLTNLSTHFSIALVAYGGYRLSYDEFYLATLRCCFEQLIAQLTSMWGMSSIDLETGLQEDAQINP